MFRQLQHLPRCASTSTASIRSAAGSAARSTSFTGCSMRCLATQSTFPAATEVNAPKRRRGYEIRDADGIAYRRPYDSAKRLTALCEAGKLDEAYDDLQTMSIHSQDVITWNTMIWHAMKAERYNLAYKMYIEMKRRNFIPNMRTYGAMLAGYTHIKDWTGRTVNLSQMHAVYDAYKVHVRRHKGTPQEQKEISVIPVNNYLRCLATIGDFDKMWEIFNEMPADGPAAANAYTYATLLSRIAERRAPVDPDALEPDSDPDLPGVQARSASPAELKTYLRNGTDALLVFRMMQNARARRSDFKMDELPLNFTLQNLLRSPLDEHFHFAQGLMQKYYGLPSPGEQVEKGQLPLSGHGLHTILSALVASRRYDACLHYGKLAMHVPRLRRVLDIGHMDDILAAYAGAAQPAAILPPGARLASADALEAIDWMLRAEHDVGTKPIVPRQASYALALRACWHAGDWPSACTIFERMTGWSASAFAEPPSLEPPAQRSAGRALAPGPEVLSNLLRTAMTTRALAHTRQALRMLGQFGTSYLAANARTGAPRGEERSTQRLSTLIVRAVDGLKIGGDAKLDKGMVALRNAAMDFIRVSNVPVRGPKFEEGPRARPGELPTGRGRFTTRTEEEDNEFQGVARRLRDASESPSP